ncbi:MAG TPA: aminotransferase class I/II-fold pyridoxal phosphate-dependent enzyme, partial [Bacteroidota bacterium]|nr:aminotransferase class I/II-fold pyridoxal phosphate-dependent enzyme [Bacteroidota bacterium]
NFVMIVRENEKDATHIFSELLKKGIIIRPLNAFGLPHCLRITIGTAEENHLFIDTLKKVLTKVPA